jgi:glucose/arabinose dehydrogenase
MFTAQRKTAAGWNETVHNMIGMGAQVPAASVDTVVAYLTQNFGAAAAAAPAAGAAAAPARSKNDPPEFAVQPWQKVPGKPIDNRAPEKQDNAADFPGQYRAPYRPSNVQYKTTTITDKLVRPWALQFLPGGKFLVTQRMGQIVIVDAAGKISEVKGVPTVAWQGGQGGLLDVALDPNFQTNHRIYFTFNEPAGPQDVTRDGAQSRIAVGRAVLDQAGLALKDFTVIFRSKPAVSVNLYPTKQGSRIAFDRDGLMYVSIGNRDSTRLQPPPWNVAQEMSSHLGKIVRITTDGAPAPGNPFLDTPDALPEIWAVGTRSQEGLTFDAQGRLWETEHGPRGGDELNLIERGKNYGWPIVTHGIDYPGWLINSGATHRQGLEDPRYFWDPNVAPSGLVFYYADLFPAWKGSLLVGGLKGGLVDRLTISGDKVIGEEPLLTELHSRIRDVRVGPEGAVYVLTDDTGMLVKVTPK